MVARRHRVFAWTGSILVINWLSLAVLDLDHLPQPLLLAYFLGSLFVHATLSAAWGAFGPGRFAMRFPLTIGWAVSLPLVVAINISIYDEPDSGAIVVVGGCLLAQWLALQFPLWALALGAGLHLRHSEDVAEDANPNQIRFGIRHLLIVILLAGVVLGIGRAIVTTVPSWGADEIVIFGFLAAAAIVLTLPLLLAALMRRVAVAGVLLALLFMGVMTAVELPLFNRLGSAGPETKDFVAINIGMGALILLVALVVRLNGYSLYTRARGAKR